MIRPVIVPTDIPRAVKPVLDELEVTYSGARARLAEAGSEMRRPRNLPAQQRPLT